MATPIQAVTGDFLVVRRGKYVPRVSVESIGALGRAVSSSPLVIETRTTDPSTPTEGMIWLRTDL